MPRPIGYHFRGLPGHAGIAQLVEHNLAKVGVAGSSPVSRFGAARRKSVGRPFSLLPPDEPGQPAIGQDPEGQPVVFEHYK